MHAVDAARIEIAVDPDRPVGMDQEALAEGSAGDEIEILLGGDQVVARPFADAPRGVRGMVVQDHGRQFGVAQVGQPAPPGPAQERLQRAGFVELFQELVRHVVVGHAVEAPGGFRDGLLVCAVGGDRVLQAGQEFPDLRDAPAGVLPVGDLQEEHVPQGLHHAPAWQHVVADVGDTGRGQVLAADAQDVLPHRLRHPAVDAVADDVVERPQVLADSGQALAVDLDVPESQALDARAARRDLRP